VLFRSYKYKGDRPTFCVKIDRDLQKLDINKGKAYPADHDFEITGWSTHAEKRLNERGVSTETAQAWIPEANIMLVKFQAPIRD
jgi:hypothetical protein